MGVLLLLGAVPMTASSGAAIAWHARGVPAVQNFRVRSISCTKASCVALVEECGPNGCGGLLPVKDFYSTNAGAKWTDGTFAAGGGNTSAVSCGSATLCVTFGEKGPIGPHMSPAIFSTSNGGKSWATKTESTLGSATSSCASATDCFVLGYKSGTGTTSAVMVTTNGAKGWVSGTFPSGKAYINSSACATATDCLASGSTLSSTAALYVSTNGGKSWKAGTAPAGMASLTNLSCNGEICSGQTSSGSEFALSSNGGKSWKTHVLPSTWTVESTSCLSATTCVAVGYSGSYPWHIAAAVTKNGGSSWTLQVLPKYFGELSTVTCVGSTLCVTGGEYDTIVNHVVKYYDPLVLTYS